MAEVNVQEKGVGLVTKGKVFVVPLLRILAFIGTAGATIVMALNKETNTFVVGTIGSNPIRLTLTAKFQHTPAFVYFVIANCIASFHNLVMLAVEFVAHKYDFKGLRFEIVPILDIIMVALVSGGATAAAFMGELGREGNSHAQWNKICDKFDTFCDRGSAAMLASFIGLFLLIILPIVSFFKYQIQRSVNYATIL